MHALPRRTILLAALLSALAGYVDAIGFMNLKGYFVSFMSGNSTRLGISFGSTEVNQVVQATGLIGAFLAGVISGSLLAHRARRHRTPMILVYVATLLFAGGLGFLAERRYLGGICQVVAMGALNMVFARKGDVAVGLTYVTGALVKTGKHIARAFMGGPKWAFVPYLTLWAGLVGGATIGASLSHLGAPLLLTFGGIYTLALIPFASRNVTLRPKES